LNEKTSRNLIIKSIENIKVLAKQNDIKVELILERIQEIVHLCEKQLLNEIKEKFNAPCSCLSLSNDNAPTANSTPGRARLLT
jgi:hypothetical protein